MDTLKNECGCTAEEWREEREIAVFWDEMASFLPKSIERSVLGDYKICNAFRAMYPKMKAYILNQHSARIVERLESLKMTERIGERTGRGAKSVSAVITNQFLDRVKDIIKDNK